LSRCFTFRSPIHVLVIGLTIAGPSASSAQWSDQGDDHDRGGPVYQRHAFEWKGNHNRHGDKHGRRFDRGPQRVQPQVNAGWFQRPYPYHLDYYKMRYGGSYAPYFGNLYGPPQVVTAPPYYGPYYGGYEFANPGDGAFNGQYSYPGSPNGAVLEGPIEQSAP